MDWSSLLVIVEVAALVALTVLCVYLITVLVRVRNLISVVEQDFRELSAKAIPIFENLEVITYKVKNVTESIDEQVESVKHSINAIRQVADNIADFERRVQERVEEPVMETIGTLTAVIKGVQAFFSRLRSQPTHIS